MILVLFCLKEELQQMTKSTVLWRHVLVASRLINREYLKVFVHIILVSFHKVHIYFLNIGHILYKDILLISANNLKRALYKRKLPIEKSITKSSANP